MSYCPHCGSVVNLVIRKILHFNLSVLLCDKVCQWSVTGRWCSPSTPVSSTNKSDRHDIAEILLKVVINNISLPLLYEWGQFLLYKREVNDFFVYGKCHAPSTLKRNSTSSLWSTVCQECMVVDGPLPGKMSKHHLSPPFFELKIKFVHRSPQNHSNVVFYFYIFFIYCRTCFRPEYSWNIGRWTLI
jgi:hypothetical protein